MGTRRSRHNKGRKPLYKEFERETHRREFFFNEKEPIVRGRRHRQPCTYCGRMMEKTGAAARTSATKDHVVPAALGGVDVVPACRQCNHLKAGMLPQEWSAFMAANPEWWKRPEFGGRPSRPLAGGSSPEIELAEEVSKFLAKRNAPHPALVAVHSRFDGKCCYCGCETLLRKRGSDMAPNSATRDHRIPKSKGGSDDASNIVLACYRCNQLKGDRDQPKPLFKSEETQFHFIDGAAFQQPVDRGEVVAASERDILLQLYRERQISSRQLRAGRRWQDDYERAAIQPPATIDWSAPLSGLHYQPRGTITQRQHDAMMRRRLAIDEIGYARTSLLDFCLDADRGRADLMAVFGWPSIQIDSVVIDLLTDLCVHYGFDIRSDASVRIRTWRTQ